jgi:hypothetical protein
MQILLIVEPERVDWYQYLKSDTRNEYLLLWYENRSDIPDWVKNEPFFRKVYYWNEFLTPGQLLKQIRPDRIIFFEIIDQRQIALLVTSNKKEIKTFYLEHGAAGDKKTAIKRANEKNYFAKTKVQYLMQRLRTGVGRLVSSKFFYYAAFLHLSSANSLLKYIKLPLKMLFYTPNKALANCLFPERTPYRSIVFNKPNFYQFQLYTGIKEESAVFTGVPLFDSYYSQNYSEEGHISYIDHPYLEGNLYGWTPEHHYKVAHHLFQLAKSRNLKVLVKLHPVSNRAIWENYKFDPKYIEIVQAGDYTKQLLASKIILAFSSSMVNGFLCARKNVVLLGWHPKSEVIGVNFSETGLCHLSLYPEEINTKFDYWTAHNLSLENEKHYDEFVKEFNYPFDGKAKNRVISTISGDEIS